MIFAIRSEVFIENISVCFILCNLNWTCFPFLSSSVMEVEHARITGQAQKDLTSCYCFGNFISSLGAHYKMSYCLMNKFYWKEWLQPILWDTPKLPTNVHGEYLGIIEFWLHRLNFIYPTWLVARDTRMTHTHMAQVSQEHCCHFNSLYRKHIAVSCLQHLHM